MERRRLGVEDWRVLRGGESGGWAGGALTWRRGAQASSPPAAHSLRLRSSPTPRRPPGWGRGWMALPQFSSVVLHTSATAVCLGGDSEGNSLGNQILHYFELSYIRRGSFLFQQKVKRYFNAFQGF
jgi:hypothetical protein